MGFEQILPFLTSANRCSIHHFSVCTSKTFFFFFSFSEASSSKQGSGISNLMVCKMSFILAQARNKCLSYSMCTILNLDSSCWSFILMRGLRFRPTSPRWRVYERCTSFFCDSFDCLSRVPTGVTMKNMGWGSIDTVQKPKVLDCNVLRQ